MKRTLLSVLFLFVCSWASGQNVSVKLATAWQRFEKDLQIANGIASLYVIEAKTGNVVLDRNAKIGLAPASTQKIITAATAYELLGKDFRYKTEFGYKGNIVDGTLQGDLYINPFGDPTFGSWRWNTTKEETLMTRVVAAVAAQKIMAYRDITINTTSWLTEKIPDGWVWQDVGNYYGAGATALNWRENQYDIVLKSGKETGSAVQIIETNPRLFTFSVSSKVMAASKGSGDNAYVYYPLNAPGAVVRGTIPVDEKRFVIAAAYPDPELEFTHAFSKALGANGIHFKSYDSVVNVPVKVFHTEYSPPLDSINFWFNRRSINLYGEALIKTIAYHRKGIGDTDEGVEIVKNFWKEKNVPVTELNIVDGSGLSPLNRITTRAQVEILQYAKRQPWFSGFYLSLPEFNGLKMKSGTIRGVKGFCGYHTSKDGTEYIFSFLVNNYNGSASALVQKMYKVLDVLK